MDLFSYTRAGQPFVYQNWLGEVLYAVVDAVGGLPLLIAWNAILAGAAMAWIVCLCHESGAGWRLATCAALPCALVLGLYSNVRPQVYSFALFACFTWVLSGFRERRRDRLWHRTVPGRRRFDTVGALRRCLRPARRFPASDPRAASARRAA